MSVNFDTRMREWREQIDQNLKNIISLTAYAAPFKEILEYAVFPGGKRLRPILFLEWHGMYAPPSQAALDFACGIELMHSYSLIHDDMPCMDNDDYRRGKPSVHKAYGEDKALLAGDALLDLSYNCMINACFNAGNCNPFFFTGISGDNGIINGQYLDLHAECRGIDDLLRIYKYKTASLIEAACTEGYLFAQKFDVRKLVPVSWGDNGRLYVEYIEGMTEEDRRKAELFGGVCKFGETFGIAFQLYDDISEYISGEKSDGTTVMDYLDLDQAKKLLNRYLNEALSALGNYGDETSTLKELVEKFVIV